MIWTPERHDLLRRLWEAGADRDTIMSALPETTWDAVRSKASKHRFYRPKWFIDKQNKSQGELEGRRAELRNSIAILRTVKDPEAYLQSKGVWYGDEMSMVRSA